MGKVFLKAALLLSVHLLMACSGSSDSKPIQTTNPNPTTNNPVLTEAEKESLVCIKSICGELDPFSHPFKLADGAQQKSAALDIVKTKLERPILNYMGHTIHKALVIDSALKTLAINKTPIQLSKEQISFYQLTSFLKNVLKNRQVIVYNDKNELAYSASELYLMLDLDQKPYFSLFKTTEKLLNAIYNINRLYNKIPYAQLLKVFYPELSIQDALVKDAELIKLGSEYLRGLSPLHVLKYADNIVIKKALEKKELSKSELNYLSTLSQDTKASLIILSTENLSKFGEISISANQVYEKLYNQYLQSETGKSFKDRTTIKQNLQNAVKQCLDKSAESYGALPNQQQMQHFEKLLAEVTQTAKSMVEKKTLRSVEADFKFEILYPLNKESAIDSWASDLDQLKTETDLILKNIKNLDPATAKNPESLFMLLALYNQNHLLDDVLSFCDKTEPAFLNDAAITSQNKIQLSWPTITNPELGLGIIAHEIGHMVSKKFPDAVYSSKNCLERKKNTEQYSEEDFADLFSSELMNKLAGKVLDVTAKNMACGLLPRDKDQWVAGSLKNAYAADEHSSGFYRLLAVAAYTDTMTTSCQSYLNKKNDYSFTYTCKW